MKTFAITLLFFLLWTSPSNADVLWTQMDYLQDQSIGGLYRGGPPSYGNYKTYDDFWFGTDVNINEISFTGLGNSYPYENTYLPNNFSVEIWSSTNPQIGLREVENLLATYTFTPSSANTTNLENNFPDDNNTYSSIFRYDLTLSTTFQAQSDTYYWISVYYLGNLSFGWQLVSNNLGQKPVTSDNGVFNSTSASNVAFELRGTTSNNNPVPEPTTMLLFGTGLAGLAGVTRRKKK
ncbi:MAG: PEP-CTERM sorting domain-containing protein [Proteobacteria bacterium]|nr:PEP-CTERM sorting domain-containing protein [Pseudomonadota bacterium]